MNQLGTVRPSDERAFARSSFKRLAKQFGRDARTDRRHAVAFACLATFVGLTGASLGSIVVVGEDDSLAEGSAVFVLFIVSSIPIWWLADRYRRSALEHRRLQEHAALFVPFVRGLRDDEREAIIPPLAQTLFSRTFEDANPLRLVTWPDSTRPGQVAAEIEP